MRWVSNLLARHLPGDVRGGVGVRIRYRLAAPALAACLIGEAMSTVLLRAGYRWCADPRDRVEMGVSHKFNTKPVSECKRKSLWHNDTSRSLRVFGCPFCKKSIRVWG